MHGRLLRKYVEGQAILIYIVGVLKSCFIIMLSVEIFNLDIGAAVRVKDSIMNCPTEGDRESTSKLAKEIIA